VSIDPTFTIVVPTYNEERNLGRLLESIKRQAGSAYTVVVVDQGSTDKTVEIALSYKCLLINLERGPLYTGLARSRNVGARASNGSMLLHLDADMELEGSDFLSQLESVISEGHHAVVIHETDVAEGFWARCKALERASYKATDMEAARAVTREVYELVGGYDESIAAGEDYIVNSRYSQQTSITSCPRLNIRHHTGRYTLRSILRKKFVYGRTTRSYVHRASQIGAASPARIALNSMRAYLENWRSLGRDPAHYLCIIPMRVMEFIALEVGILVGPPPGVPLRE
jgi:arabinofuranan 3-O-arabinosyltransferase